MAENLVDFQKRLSERLDTAEREKRPAARLGFSCCGQWWLVELASLREARAAPSESQMVALRMVKPWIRGCASLGGRALTLVDLQAFMGGGFSQLGEEARTLELAERYDAGCAFLVERVSGLTRLEDLKPLSGEQAREVAASVASESWGAWSAAAWAGADSLGGESRVWHELDLEKLLAAPEFWNAWEAAEPAIPPKTVNALAGASFSH